VRRDVRRDRRWRSGAGAGLAGHQQRRPGRRLHHVLKRALLAAALLIAIAIPPARASVEVGACDWPMFGHDEGRSFAAPVTCTALTPVNAATLRPKWYVPMPDAVSASPAIVGGKVYVGDWAGNFYRLDAATGAINWTYTIDDTSNVGFGHIVSSAAYAVVGGRGVVVFGGGATLYVL